MDASGVIATVSGLSQIPTNELIFFVAMFFAAVFGFSAGYTR
jgi:hypothetical protein